MTNPLIFGRTAASDMALQSKGLEDLRRRGNLPWRTLNVVFDGRGSPLTTGIKGDAGIDFECIIRSWALFADVAGDIVIDVWREGYAGFPPVDADSITGGAEPELGGGIKNSDDALIGWDLELDVGDVLRFNIDSVDGIVERVTLALKLEAL